MEFLRSFFRRHLVGKPVVASPNVDCFVKLVQIKQKYRSVQKMYVDEYHLKVWYKPCQVPKTLTFKLSLSTQPFIWKWVFYLPENINDFHFKDIILNYILKIRLDGTRKRPTRIILLFFLSKEIHNTSSFPGSFPTRSPNSREGTSRTGTR